MRFHKVVLFCRETERARAFYEAVGFPYLRGYEGMHWFRYGDGELMLHPHADGPAGHPPQLYAEVQDLDALFARVRAAGLVPVDHQTGEPVDAPVTRPWGAREVELVDPEGHWWGFVEG